MANKKISQLTTNVSPLVTDLFATVNGGITKKITLSGLTSFFQNNLIFQDKTITGGTFSNNTLNLTDNSGNTISITGFTGEVFVTGGTYTAGTATFTNNTGGTFSVSGFSTGSTSLLFGLTDSAATENRYFSISGYTFDISDNPNGLNFKLDSRVNGGHDIYLQSRNQLVVTDRFADFGLFNDDFGNPGIFFDVYGESGSDASVGAYLDSGVFGLYAEDNANILFDGIRIDNTINKILGLDGGNNVKYVNKSELVFPTTYFTGIVDYGDADVNLTLDYPTGGTGLSVSRTGSLNFNPGNVFLADAYGVHLPLTSLGTVTGTSEVLALDYTLDRMIVLRKVAMEEFTPSSSGDSYGVIGQVTYDNSNIYVKSNVGWFKTQIYNLDLPSFNTINTPSIALNGDGSVNNPLYATSLIPSITNGIITGGDVTWISGYTYSVSPATYYINSILYTSPYTQLTLESADTVNNRIDVFVLTISGDAQVITGTAATNPEQPSINTATQIQNSFALVIANSTSPSVGREFIYLENTEWTTSATTGFNVASTNNPYSGSVDIEATTLVNGNAVSFTRSTSFQPLINHTVLVLYIRSKATWNSNRKLELLFKNGNSVVGTTVSISNTTTYGFNSSITNAYQRIVIPLSNFSLTPSDTVDKLFITAAGSGGVMGFYLDNIELQGANPTPTVMGTTDNIGVFYVNKNYSGTGGTIVSGFTLSTIYSTNGGYNSQLVQARMGDMNKAYPCPWSARNAAMQAMTGGVITKAYIKVLGGSQYTIGNILASGNGTISGETASTVADIAFASGTDISSLMKNNIFYDFEENTKLTWINRSGQFYIGYNVDATHTGFKSAIYGKCDFIQVFDETPGRGQSQRAFRFSNSRGDYQVDGNTVIANGFFFVNVIHKSFITNFNTSYLTRRGSLIGMTNTGSENNGDGTPSIMMVNVQNLYKGPQYFPYISLSGTGGIQPIFAMDCSSAIRSKYITFNVKNMYVKEQSSQNIYSGFVTPINRDVFNWFMMMNIDYLQHDIDIADQEILGASAPLITTMRIGDTSSRIRNNFHENFNIKQAYINNGLIQFIAYNAKNASSRNTSITFNSDEIIKFSMVGTPSASHFYSDAIFGLPTLPTIQGNTYSGEKVKVQINVGRATAISGSVFTNSGWFEGAGIRPVYPATTTIRGTYITNGGSPVMILNGTGHTFVLDNVTFIAKSSATETISVDNGSNPVYIYGKNVDMNLSASTAVTQYGVFVSETQLNNFL